MAVGDGGAWTSGDGLVCQLISETLLDIPVGALNTASLLLVGNITVSYLVDRHIPSFD